MLIDSNKLIEAIKDHANNCAEGEGVIDQAYKLAHYHIIELVNLFALRAEAESKTANAKDLISREAIKTEISNLYNDTLDGLVKFGIEKAYKEIDKAPAITKGGKTDEQ